MIVWCCYRLLYVGLAVVICAIVAGCLLFFLISRSVTVNSNVNVIRPSNVTVVRTNTSESLVLLYQVRLIMLRVTM